MGKNIEDDGKIETTVRNFVDELLNKSETFKGDLECIGSYYEGMKIKEADEYDFIYKLNSTFKEGNLKVEQIRPAALKYQEPGSVYPRTYCRVSRGDCEIHAAEWLSDFKDYLVEQLGCDTPISINGPAVTILTRLTSVKKQSKFSKETFTQCCCRPMSATLVQHTATLGNDI